MHAKKRTVVFTLVAFTVLAVLAVVAVSAPASLAQGTSATPAPRGAGDNSWGEVVTSGKLIVGTAVDYPPFEFYTPDFKIDGFDIALMQDLGRRLGVQVVFKDFAFDGLYGALELGQIDATIAAISVTPEREQVVDFTDVYYVGQDAILAQSTSSIRRITDVNQMSGLRIGVERGTIYETWLRDELLDTGLMDDSDLMLYLSLDQALRDLRAGRIDLAVMDDAPAQVAIAAGGVKLVGRGLNKQVFAIAVPKGAIALRDKLNVALTAAKEAGVIRSLADKYLDLDPSEILPIPTPPPVPPTPMPTPTPEPERCVDAMTFVSDVTFNDYNMKNPPALKPGQPFTKVWRVKNTGTCDWDQTYSAACARGDCMGGTAVRVDKLVKPGQTYDIKAPLTAPTKYGTYQGFWEMRNWANVPFGERFWVGITVPAPAPPTPVPPPTPLPGAQINFWADSYSLQGGQCTTVHWSVENVREVYFYAVGQPWQGVTGREDRQVCPPTTTTYELRVVKNDGNTEIRQLTINVSAPPAAAPTISWFGLFPASEIQLGQCVEISWEVQGNVSSVTILQGNNAIWDGAPIRGNTTHCPTSPGQVGYTIVARGPGGQAQDSKYIQVLAQAVPM